MQTIVTKYHGPGNVRGSRISARTTSGLSKTVGYDDALSVEANHRAAAKALATKLDWRGTWVEGCYADGQNVYVLLTGEPAFTVVAP